jgi:hypothetical protein
LSSSTLLACGAIAIPNTITSIASYYFNSTNITSVTIGSSLTTIGGGAFQNCPISQISLDGSNTSFVWVGSNSQNGFVRTIGDTTTINPLGSGSGLACGNISIPAGVTSVADGAFNGSNGLKQVDFRNTDAITFGMDWCYKCYFLSSVIINSTVTYINDGDDGWDEVGPNTGCTLYANNEAAANTFRSNIIVGNIFNSSEAAKWVYQYIA